MSYTVRDTPAVVARIQADLGAAVKAIREADPRARSVVLTGGFARGEGAVLDGRPQNDYDLVVVRGVGRPRTPYPVLRKRLEARVGLHVDLAGVQSWRLPFVPPTIFWYEAGLRGRLLWGLPCLHRIPLRRHQGIDPAEGLRLLVNRGAGLLLCTASNDAVEVRLQAAKAFLAVADARLLARGRFAPSQTERWALTQRLAPSMAPWAHGELGDWLAWAFQTKTDPEGVADRDPEAAWRAAARALLDAVPPALAHAGMASLDDYARSDHVVDHFVYAHRARAIPGARPLAWHPTARVRVATLRLLEDSLDGRVSAEAASRRLGAFGAIAGGPLGALEALRRATLQ